MCELLRNCSRIDLAPEASPDLRMCWHSVAPNYSRSDTSSSAACSWRKYDLAVNELYCEKDEHASTTGDHEDRVGQDYISIRPVSLALGAVESRIYK